MNYVENNGYLSDIDNESEESDEELSTIYYCVQEDFDMCNNSGKIVRCPIEIECQTSEANSCCEGIFRKSFLYLFIQNSHFDQDGIPYCGGWYYS